MKRLEKRKEFFLQGHSNSVNSVAFTNDYKYLISGSQDKTVIIWNLLDKRQEIV